MKKQILIIIVIIIFVVGLILLNIFMNRQNNSDEITSTISDVTNENFEEEVLNADKIVLVDFYADWCEPCKVFSPILEDIANDYDYVKVVKVNIDYETELAEHYGVISIPTLITFKNGKIADRCTGVVNKLSIIDIIKQLQEQ